MSSSSNSYFSGVSKEIYGKVNAGTVNSATVNAGSVRTGTINCDSVQISLPKAAATVKIAAWNATYYELITADMALMARGQVLLDDNATTGGGTLAISTADTAAEALRLLSLFNIADTSTTRLITFSHINTVTNGAIINIGGNAAFVAAATRNYVKYKSNTGTVGLTAPLFAASAVRDAYVLVYRDGDYLNSPTIIFEVIGYAAS